MGDQIQQMAMSLARVLTFVALVCAVSARSSGRDGKKAALSQRKFFCSPVTNIAPFCTGATPTKVCTSNGQAVDGSVFTAEAYNTAVNASCPKNNALFTKSVFCKGGLRPPLPCTRDTDCDIPLSLTQCYGLCVAGGTTGKTAVLGASQCQLGSAQAYCNGAFASGTVAAPGDDKCLGLTDFIEQEARDSYGASVWRPRICYGRLPIGNQDFSKMDKEGRKQFALELTMKINAMIGYCKLNEDQTKWVNKQGDTDCLDDEWVYKRPGDIRSNRVQLLNGYPTVFVQIKQFCTIPYRKGKAVYLDGEPNDNYCDAPSLDPEIIFKNLTKQLEDNMGPDKSTPLTIGPYPRLKWDKKFEIPYDGKPMMPSYCEFYKEHKDTDPPQWVWAVVGVSSMVLLLSLLILQHRYRNRVAYARSKDRTYA